MKVFDQPLNPAAHVLLVVVVILTAMTAWAAPTWQGHEDYEDGILTIYNPTAPLNEPSVIQPKPQWRLGGDDDETETLFGLITDAQRNADGTTYLLDAVMSTVYEVSTTGEVKRTLGHEGDGPGEFRNAISLALLPDRSVGIVEMMPSRMIVLGPDGLPRPSVEFEDDSGGRSHVQRLAVNGDQMVMGMMSTRFNEGKAEIRHILGTYNLDGSLRTKVLHSFEEQSGGSISISAGGDNDFVNNWAMGPGGEVAVHRNGAEYLVEVFGADGEPVHHIRREYKSVRLPEEELAELREQREQMQQRFQGSVDLEINEVAPDIDDVVVRPDGELWVLSSQGLRDCPAGSIGVFDVFDAKGRFVRQTSITADYDPDNDQFLLRGNHLYVLKEANNAPDRTFSGGGGSMMMMISSGGGGSDDEDEDEEPRPYEVICYELPAGM